MDNCIFCKIRDGVINSEKLYEDDVFFVIRDLNPQAPIHLLAIVKDHHKYLSELDEAGMQDIAHILSYMSKHAKDFKLDAGYRVIINQGENAGQTVPHIHIHFLGGKKLDF